MTDLTAAGTYKLGDRTVKRMGYGAMQLAGPGVSGPPKDRDAAIAVLRAAVAAGVNHIDTSDYYGPYFTNQIIREALHPYPDDLVIVTKLGSTRGAGRIVEPRLLARGVDSGGAQQPAQSGSGRDRRRQPAADVRPSGSGGGFARRAAWRARGPAAAGTDPPHRAEQHHSRPAGRSAQDCARSYACRTPTILPTAPTTR